MSSTSFNSNEIKPYTKVTDTIYAVLIGLSFREYYTLIIPVNLNYKIAVLIFIYLVLIGSRVTYENSIIKKPYRDKKRFLVDLFILYLYYMLVFSIKIDQRYDTGILISIVMFIFFSYTIWDALKYKEYDDKPLNGIIFTALFSFFSFLIFISYHQPVFLFTKIIIDNSLREWGYLFSEYLLFILFWTIKIK